MWLIQGTRVDFTDESTKTFIFPHRFHHTPVVRLLVEETGEAGSGNISAFVSSTTKMEVIIKTSEKFTGKVHVQAFSKT